MLTYMYQDVRCRHLQYVRYGSIMFRILAVDTCIQIQLSACIDHLTLNFDKVYKRPQLWYMYAARC